MAIFAPIAALLVSVAFLLMGNGLQGTLLPIRAEIEAFAAFEIGVMGSAYFLGFAAGCLAGPYIVARVGHIRAFAAATALASTVALVHALITWPITWWVLRALTGASLAILYMVIESWLNERATNKTRGTVMSVYTVINLSMIMVGQFLLTIYPPSQFGAFALASILVSLATLPVALTSAMAPAPLQTVQLRFLHLYRASPVGWIGALAVGLGNGAFWALSPVFARGGGLDLEGVALFMALAVLGGAIGQYPLGWLSDRMDRRRVILGGALGVVIAGAAMPVLSGLGANGLLAGAFLFGLSAMPVYALCVAHMNDHVASDGFVEASTCMLLVFAGGAVAGPMLASLITAQLGFGALFPYISVVYGLFAVFVLIRMRARAAPPTAEKSEFVLNPGTSPVVNGLDPRAEPYLEAAADGKTGPGSESPTDPRAGQPSGTHTDVASTASEHASVPADAGLDRSERG